MHQCIGQFTICRKQQQTGRGHVQSADSNPSRSLNLGQRVKNQTPAFRVRATGDFVGWLIVDKVPVHLGRRSDSQSSAVQRDGFRSGDFVAQYGNPAIDAKPAGLNPALDFAA